MTNVKCPPLGINKPRLATPPLRRRARPVDVFEAVMENAPYTMSELAK